MEQIRKLRCRDRKRLAMLSKLVSDRGGNEPGCWAPRPHWHGHRPCSRSDHLPLSRCCHSSALLEVRVWDPCRDPGTLSPHLPGLDSFSIPPGLRTVHPHGPCPALSQARRISKASQPVSQLPGFSCFNPSSGGCQRPPPESFMLLPQQDAPAAAAGDRVRPRLGAWHPRPQSLT